MGAEKEQTGSGRDSLHKVLRGTDRSLLLDIVIQMALAAGFGWLYGAVLETGGWLVDAEGQPLSGALAVGFAWSWPFVWGFIMLYAMQYWRDSLQLFYIPLLRKSFLLYAVLEHQPHDSARLPLCSMPPVLTLKNKNPIRTFAARISSLVWALPLISRQLGYGDYPAGWGRVSFAVLATGVLTAVLAAAFPSGLWRGLLALPAFLLLAGWLGFQQSRLRASAWCVAAVFLPPKGD